MFASEVVYDVGEGDDGEGDRGGGNKDVVFVLGEVGEKEGFDGLGGEVLLKWFF